MLQCLATVVQCLKVHYSAVVTKNRLLYENIKFRLKSGILKIIFDFLHSIGYNSARVHASVEPKVSPAEIKFDPRVATSVTTRRKQSISFFERRLWCTMSLIKS